MFIYCSIALNEFGVSWLVSVFYCSVVIVNKAGWKSLKFMTLQKLCLDVVTIRSFFKLVVCLGVVVHSISIGRFCRVCTFKTFRRECLFGSFTYFVIKGRGSSFRCYCCSMAG